ncbi:MAG TPA: asparagine synthase (glutamine-hydrolyzing) [Gemmatimonadales bacterium]|nr:asparagine synthase (glutamine-hydrolyzing) [Gemmatimonadales bacterium]
MCGFGGIILPHGGEVSSDLLARIGATLDHRGPDGTHVAQLPGAGLVHCRLAIIDLSARADQPMSRADLGATIAFNGEIYNFRELRAERQRRGLAFSSDSDTELVLASLAEDGPASLRRLRGMFALAFWRPADRSLLLARDPLGKKPLFYAWRGDGALVFGSTLDAIVTALGRTPAVSPAAVADYLAHMVVPQERVIYEGVHRVPPGSWIRFDGTREVARGAFWEPATGADWRGSGEELASEIERLLRQSVRRRLVSDVPVGAFLSAGLDSGTIVALMAEEAGEPVRTFSAGTTGDPLDERPAARAVAERYGTRHEEVDVPPLSAAALPLLVWQAGEPFGDASLLPSARVAAAARGRVSVALTGDGGDELFFGYSVFQGVRRAEQLRRVVPGPVIRAARRALGDDTVPGIRNRLDALLEYASAPIAQSFRNRMGWHRAARARLLRHVEREPAERIYARRLERYAHLPDADALRRTLLGTWLPNDYLTKVDVATMAVGLEARSPFLDLDLVEFLLRVPAGTAFPAGEAKALLKPLARRLLPPAILARRKTGFGIPVREWLLGPLSGAWRRFVTEPGRAIHEWIDPAEAEAAYRELRGGSVRADRVWLLFVLGVWGAMTLEGSLAADEPLLERAA